MWTFTNKENLNGGNYSKTILGNKYAYHMCDSTGLQSKGEIKWIYCGHVFLRGYKNHNIQKLPTTELLDVLYSEHKEAFIHQIKGNFIVIRIEKNSFSIYSDRFAIKKFFYWQSGKEFIISNDLKEITRNINATLSKENIAKYAVTYHFTNGSTAFANIRHNEPGQIIEFKEGELHHYKYWQPQDLLELRKRHVPISEIAEALSKAVDLGLEHIDKSKVSLSLTGGADTRNLLAVFLKKGISPHLYTYGDPESDDCIKAKTIADGLGLAHQIHDIQMTASLFEEYARKIIRQGGGLASIHRAHRIMAVEREKEFAENMFLGTLGGEFIKGVSEDDYIVPSIVYENWENQNYSLENLLEITQKKFILPKKVDFDILLSIVKNEPYMKGDVINRKVAALSFITAHLHDAQDINLYCNLMNDVFTPFLDIDYLEIVFSSQYTFDNKEKVKNKYLKRLINPVYASHFIKSTYPPLLQFLYSGDHKPSDVLFNKYYAAFMKIIRKRKTKGRYKPNFPLNGWMEEFVQKNLPLCYNYKELYETFDLDALMRELKTENHKPKESYWLRFTNPIMMRFIIEEYNR